MQGKVTLSGSWEHADGVGRSCDAKVRLARTCPLRCSQEPGNFLIQVEQPFCPPPALWYPEGRESAVTHKGRRRQVPGTATKWISPFPFSFAG